MHKDLRYLWERGVNSFANVVSDFMSLSNGGGWIAQYV
jgi:hypothetical protein